MVSCVDTVLLPDDKTVEEDFWQTKEDVTSMVNGAYSAMATANVQTRVLVWASRSDEMNVNSSLSNSELNQINSANIQTDNGYNNWASLYSVINDCNLVIDKSAEVMDIDPNYLEGDHLNYVGQMKALRALCYFYLIRVFHDVPMSLEPYKESSAEMNIPQVAPSVILEQIISDLEEVKTYTLSSQSVSDWHRMGNFTRDGVLALLADVYLWKGAIYHDEASYDKVIECANTIRNNRSTETEGAGQFGMSTSGLDDDGFNLNPYYNYFNLFINGGNDTESLFEIQYSDNTGIRNIFDRISNSTSSQPYFYTNSVYATVSSNDDGNHVFTSSNYENDVRGFESIYNFNAGAEDQIKVRKQIAETSLSSRNITTLTAESPTTRTYTNYDQNFIYYRTTDVMLMKAEALVEKARLQVESAASLAEQLTNATDATTQLSLANELRALNLQIAGYNVTAARQVQIVNTRANIEEESSLTHDSTYYAITSTAYTEGTDVSSFATTQLSDYNSFSDRIDELEKMVMDERARELCFEGKRWFDMMRYNYRHVTGVNYDEILANQGGTFVTNYSDMLSLISRKYTSGGGSAVTSKMPTEPYLYMPIYKSEMEVNSSLVQNPVYKDNATAERND